jgi:hypothetical protein
MNNIKINCSWELEFELLHEKQIELFVDYHQINTATPDSIKVLFLLEPEDILPLAKNTIQNHDKFDYILTHNKEILENCPNAHLFEFATTWIKDYTFPEKKFEVSTLVGGKTLAPGHFLRQKLWYKENRIKIPKKFFISGNQAGNLQNYNNNPVLGAFKDPLFDSQFHIVIENAKRDYWFTEKLIDCLQTKSIPIYWGCPNIGNYFNLKGMFIVNNINEIINICNKLTPETYSEMYEFAEENYQKSNEFTNIAERLKNKIEKIIK